MTRREIFQMLIAFTLSGWLMIAVCIRDWLFGDTGAMASCAVMVGGAGEWGGSGACGIFRRWAWKCSICLRHRSWRRPERRQACCSGFFMMGYLIYVLPNCFQFCYIPVHA